MKKELVDEILKSVDNVKLMGEIANEETILSKFVVENYPIEQSSVDEIYDSTIPDLLIDMSAVYNYDISGMRQDGDVPKEMVELDAIAYMILSEAVAGQNVIDYLQNVGSPEIDEEMESDIKDMIKDNISNIVEMF